MQFKQILSTVQRITVDHSPAILTAVGVVGTVTTAVLTGQATVKAVRFIDKGRELAEEESIPPLSTKTVLHMSWPFYIPPVVSGVTTITAIILANRIGTRRTAAIAAAYAIAERAASEYQDKVVETIGKNKEQKIQDAIAQDRVDARPVSGSQILVTGRGDVLCMDAWSGRYFTSDMESIKSAQNAVNYDVLNHGYGTLSDFYNKLGLAPTKESDEVGWNSDKLLELSFSTTMSDDNRPCLVMDFVVAPVRDFFRTH